MVERDPMRDAIDAVTRTMEDSTGTRGQAVPDSKWERIRGPKDIVQPDGFPREWLDRNFGGVNMYLKNEFGTAKSPLQTTLDRLGALGSVTLLDVGCGTGNTLRLWADFVRKHANDPSDVKAIGLNLYDYSDESMSERTREAIQRGDIQYLVGDAESMSQIPEIPEQSVDVTLAFMSLVHMRRPLRTIRHIERSMSPGGVAFIQVHRDMMLSNSPLSNDIYRWEDKGYIIDNTHYDTSEVPYIRIQKPENA